MTSEITPYSFQHNGKTFVLVDTPGFDDSHVSDRDILAKLLAWLNTNYEKNQKLNGILYLHRIDAPRMQGTALRNFKMFKELCGEGFYENLCLGTTCWRLLKEDTGTGERREADLKDKGGFWHPMIAKGSLFKRIPEEQDAAREIISELAAKQPAFLKSQIEMGKDGLSPEKVSAAKTLDEDIEKLREENEKKMRLERENLERQSRDREKALKAEHERQKRQREELLRKQEIERERVLRLERGREAQRQREMEALEEQLRQTRLEEERQRERERVERQKRLDNTQFALEFQKLFYAKKYGRVSTGIYVSYIDEEPQVCGNCFRFLENEKFWREINFP